MNSEELKDKYKHFSIRNFPFQDTIIDAIPEKGIPYSDREIWFKHIYLSAGLRKACIKRGSSEKYLLRKRIREERIYGFKI